MGYPRRVSAPLTDREIIALQRYIGYETANSTRVFQYRVMEDGRYDSVHSGFERFRVEYKPRRMRFTVVLLERFAEALRSCLMLMVKRVANLFDLRGSDKIYVWVKDGRVSVSIRPTRLDEFDASTLFELIGRVIQSSEEFRLQSAVFTVAFFRGRRGTGYLQSFTSEADFCVRKSCILEIKNVDGVDCFWLAFAVAYAQIDNVEEFEKMRRTSSRRRVDMADYYKHMAEWDDVDGGVSLGDIDRIEAIFEVNIKIIRVLGLTWLRRDNNVYRKTVYLTIRGLGDNRDEWHFDVVDRNHLSALFAARRFCVRCMKAYSSIKHACKYRCPSCLSDECGGSGRDRWEFERTCRKCFMPFFDEACDVRHIDSGRCGEEVRCVDCGVVEKVRGAETRNWRNARSSHVCYRKMCPVCEVLMDVREEHFCFHRNARVDGNGPIAKFIFYDFECYLDDGHHKVALVIALYGHSDEVFEFRTVEAFCGWLFQKRHKGYTCVAHNGGKYDMHFVKQYMLKHHIVSEDIVKGRCIMYSNSKAYKIRFVDSMKYIATSLRRFPKTFGFAELEKGFFPYRFFTSERGDYVGELPGITWFDFDMMKAGERREGVQWYEERHRRWQGGEVYDIWDECRRYCVDDVRILKKGCLQFQKLILDITNGVVDPFRSLTIAGVCMRIYKTFDMPSRTIAVLKNDYMYRALRVACEWFYYLMQEGRIDGYENVPYNDFYCVEGIMPRELYVFLPCASMGCRQCFSPFTQSPVSGLYMHEVRHWRHKDLDEVTRGYDIVHMKRECEWNKERHEIVIDWEDMRERCTMGICMRDGFYGGRTEAIKLYYRVREGEEIHLYDFRSHYPSIQMGMQRGLTDLDEEHITPYPVGIPTRYIFGLGDHPDVSDYFGFVKCDIIPPEGLYLPLLPERRDGKLIFDLRRKTGVWTTVEVERALQLGYKIVRVFEILHFEETSVTLFQPYVRRFLKLKQESAGWAKLGLLDATDEEKECYMLEFEAFHGVRLDTANIGDFNPGLYNTAKWALNSLWGKLAQRNKFRNVVDVYSDDDCDRYLHSDIYDVRDVFFHEGGAKTITHSLRKDYAFESKSANMPIAAYTTAYARLRLYDALEVLGRRVLYMDTDSVMFVKWRTDEEIPLATGRYLGDLTNELSDGEYIEEFVSTGPKSYAYVTNKGKRVTKIKGFTLNVAAESKLNMHSMKRLVQRSGEEYKEKPILTQPLMFDIDAEHNITTRQWKAGNPGKAFKFTFDKRRRLPAKHWMIDTVPLTEEDDV